MQRFSDHFKLGKSQVDLDFVDIPLEADMPLYVDPYALGLEHDDWFIRCNDLVVDYFQLVVASIKEGNQERAKQLLAHLHEPNDTHLGLSHGQPRGRGIGTDQADQLYERLAGSKAVQTGVLRDLADAELMIPGIGSDKISDITTNIIKSELIAYTALQCHLHGIPTRSVPAGIHWDGELQNWKNCYVQLPVYRERRILLVPKAAVRYRLSFDHQEYYRNFVLEFLQGEHLRAGSSLVTLLKNGKRKVYKKDLKRDNKVSKEMLYEFTEAHPDVLEKYKASLPTYSNPPDDEGIEQRQPEPRGIGIAANIEQLKAIPTGRAEASTYHDFIVGALTAIFYPALVFPTKEQDVDEGRKRIDIMFANRATKGFFYHVNTINRITCPYIFFECKNYTHDVQNPEIDQLVGRFNETRGLLGFVVCRSIKDKATLLKRCKDVLNARRGYVLVLEDLDIEALLRLRANRDDAGIDSYMDVLLNRLLM